MPAASTRTGVVRPDTGSVGHEYQVPARNGESWKGAPARLRHALGARAGLPQQATGANIEGRQDRTVGCGEEHPIVPD
jgi:hypothetical protein